MAAVSKPRRRARETPPWRISGDRLQLRAFGRRELMSDEYFRWMNDVGVTQWIGRADYLLPVTRAKLAAYVASIDTASAAFLAIYDETGGAPAFAGTLKLYDMDSQAGVCWLGILVGPEHQGRAVATRAINAACGHVFTVLGYRKVSAGFMSTNVAMAKAFENAGFQIEGTLRAHTSFRGALVDNVLVARFRPS